MSLKLQGFFYLREQLQPKKIKSHPFSIKQTPNLKITWLLTMDFVKFLHCIFCSWEPQYVTVQVIW